MSVPPALLCGPKQGTRPAQSQGGGKQIPFLGERADKVTLQRPWIQVEEENWATAVLYQEESVEIYQHLADSAEGRVQGWACCWQGSP